MADPATSKLTVLSKIWNPHRRWFFGVNIAVISKLLGVIPCKGPAAGEEQIRGLSLMVDALEACRVATTLVDLLRPKVKLRFTQD
jgi:hypothetical protein